MFLGFVHKHGPLAVRIQIEEFLGFILEVAFDQFVGEPFFRQDKPCPVGVGSRTVGKELHRIHLAIWSSFLAPSGRRTQPTEPGRAGLDRAVTWATLRCATNVCRTVWQRRERQGICFQRRANARHRGARSDTQPADIALTALFCALRIFY